MKTRILEVVKLLTTKEATTILVCHLETLYQWVKQGKIGCIRTGRNLKFHPQHIQEYFEPQSRSV
jgi:excisionase family DNA binding protein